MTDMTVAKTILNQLGGNRFAAMVGAKDFVASEVALTFKIGRGAKNKANKCRVTLDPSDTYTMEFFSVRGASFKHKGEATGLYFDMLQDEFTRATGFYTSL